MTGFGLSFALLLVCFCTASVFDALAPKEVRRRYEEDSKKNILSCTCLVLKKLYTSKSYYCFSFTVDVNIAGLQNAYSCNLIY